MKLNNVIAKKADNALILDLKDVNEFSIRDSEPLEDLRLEEAKVEKF